MSFNRKDPTTEACEDRRVITRTGADLERTMPLTELELLSHQRHHVRLADRLALPDRQGHILISLILEGSRHEFLSWRALDRAKHSRVADPGTAQLHQQPQLLLQQARLGQTNGIGRHSSHSF